MFLVYLWHMANIEQDQAQKNLTYAETGVDVGIEAKAARILYEAAKETWVNRKGTIGEVVVPYDDFSGLRYIRVAMLPPGTVMYGNTDGVATKVEFAERAGKYDTLAFDLITKPKDILKISRYYHKDVQNPTKYEGFIAQ